MIIFKKLRYKNFLSTGNNWTELELNNTKSTLIVGHNGAGKSTMLDAISFVLFGKPHRNINKPQLVNSINNKDCLVEVEFRVGSVEYKVVRGLKPQVFEIWKNEVMIDQASHSKEYQKILEQNILKLTHKSFHQIVVLGSSSFIPFMQLSAQARREVIEDLLDINIFSKMNMLIKEKQSIIREKIKDLSYQIDLNKTKIAGQTKYIHDMSLLNEAEIANKLTSLEKLHKDIEALQEENLGLTTQITKDQKTFEETLNRAHDKKHSLLSYKASFSTKITGLVKDAKFYENHTHCPTCTQEIEESLRESKLKVAKEEAAVLQSAIRKAEEETAKVLEVIEEFTEKVSVLRGLQSSILANNQEIGRLQRSIREIEEDIERVKNRDGDLQSAKDEKTKLMNLQTKLSDEKFEANEQAIYNNVLAEMLKDTGIKTKVIKQYLPVINKLVNQYLQILDFFVHFNLDEEFKENIRSRHRDSFSYDSFSEGEKQRIDLSLLFTWRMIAKMKNSVATNLLILDETFDSSLDFEGVDNLMKILYTLDDDTNVFVISHKGEILDGKFNRKIEFMKEKNFSIMK